MAEKKEIVKPSDAAVWGPNGRVVAISLVVVLLGGLALLYGLAGATAALFAASLVGFFAVFVFLPDAIAAWRGTQLKLKSDLAGDEIGLPFIILAFPYRLWQALTAAPTKELRGWPALFADNREKTGSSLADQGESSSLIDQRIEKLASALSDQQYLALSDAAPQLQVTTVTIKRYISEFGIETVFNTKGKQLLPPNSVEELREIRRLKHSGLSNEKVLTILKEKRNEPLQ